MGIGREDTDHAQDCIQQFGLASYDAAHAGTMRTYDLHHIATADADFAEVKGLTLWMPQFRYLEIMAAMNSPTIVQPLHN